MKKMIYVWVFVLSVIFFFYSVAFGDSVFGPDPSDEDCQCVKQLSSNGDQLPPVPKKKKGPFLHGNFTISRDNTTALSPPADANYIVHITLRHGRKVHLFSFSWPVDPLDDLCQVDEADLKTAFAFVPCDLNVEVAFGMVGTPLIRSLTIRHVDNCKMVPGPPNSGLEEMIRGKVVIGMVDTATLEALCEEQ